jgi:UDP-3-O-[3-hydroxymyristoyl] glucosamine N-acyltransferase
MFVPISFRQMSHLRASKYFAAKAKGYTLISYISSKATIWPGFTGGDNCSIFEDNTIQPFVTIGNDVVMLAQHLAQISGVNLTVGVTCHDLD